MKAREEREKLERMIDEAESHIRGNVPSSSDIPELNSAPSFEIDYDQLQRDCDKQARKHLKNATGLMIGDEMLKNNSYLREKLKTDTISLAGMLYQMAVTKIMQRDLIEEVRHGAKHPRMYEVFSTLGKTISENNKQLLQTVEAIKETYITLRQNITERNEELKQISGIRETEAGLITMGSRDLIQQTKKNRLLNISNSNISDVQIEE